MTSWHVRSSGTVIATSYRVVGLGPLQTCSVIGTTANFALSEIVDMLGKHSGDEL